MNWQSPSRWKWHEKTRVVRLCRAIPFAQVLMFGSPVTAQPIDRHALVSRHNPVLRKLDLESPLSVGNGQFAFTADVTGLQTFPEAFEKTIPLGTLSGAGTVRRTRTDGASTSSNSRSSTVTDARLVTPISPATARRRKLTGCDRTRIGCTWVGSGFG
jgi:hypothetical protein